MNAMKLKSLLRLVTELKRMNAALDSARIKYDAAVFRRGDSVFPSIEAENGLYEECNKAADDVMKQERKIINELLK